MRVDRYPVARVGARTGVIGMVLAMLALTGCNPFSDNSPSAAAPSGTLVALGSSAPSLDPQKVNDRAQLGLASRLYLRTLTAYSAGDAKGRGSKLVGDLATNTGTSSKSGRSWKFTLRPGARWQDGSAVTCADVRYGISRAFDAKLTQGRIGNAVSYLAIPKKSNGSSTYGGPRQASSASAKAAAKNFNAAVSCAKNVVTFRLSERAADFPSMLASAEFAPVRKGHENDGFSNGPYRLSQPWDATSGGSWERSKSWSKAADPVRNPKAPLLQTTYEQNQEQVTTQLNSESGGHVLGLDPMKGEKSTISANGQLTDYLAPNTSRGPMRKEEVRRAFALATNRKAYVDAVGAGSMQAQWSLLSGNVPGSHPPVKTVNAGEQGSASRAKAELKKAKVTSPIKVALAYRQDPTLEKALTGMLATWKQAGFEVTLKPISQDYFATISTTQALTRYDLFWSNWGADYPSADTILPLLFNSRANLVGKSTGRNYGALKDAALDAAMTKAGQSGSATAWRKIDMQLVGEGAYIALAQQRLTYRAGDRVAGVGANPSYGGGLDLAKVTLEAAASQGTARPAAPSSPR